MNAKKILMAWYQKEGVNINVTILSARTSVHVIKDILLLMIQKHVKVGKEEKVINKDKEIFTPTNLF